MNETSFLREKRIEQILCDVIDDNGGPLIYGVNSEQQQRSFDSTAVSFSDSSVSPPAEPTNHPQIPPTGPFFEWGRLGRGLRQAVPSKHGACELRGRAATRNRPGPECKTIRHHMIHRSAPHITGQRLHLRERHYEPRPTK